MRVDAQVMLENKVLAELERADFLVRDEGVPQDILYFGRETEPLRLLLLLDVSGSMRSQVEGVAKVSREALKSLREGDEVAVMAFSRRARVHLDFTPDIERVSREIGPAARDSTLGSGTATNAAILEAARYMSGSLEGRAGRRAIIIVTDNRGLNYLTPDEDTLRELLAADVVLNAVLAANASRPKPPPAGAILNPEFTPTDVPRLADASGGEALQARQAPASFRALMERIRARYSLHFRPQAATGGEFRRIQVELTEAAARRYPRARVLARSGYYAPR